MRTTFTSTYRCRSSHQRPLRVTNGEKKSHGDRRYYYIRRR